MTPEGRKRLSAALRKRWAAKMVRRSTVTTAPDNPAKKNAISPAGRKRLAGCNETAVGGETGCFGGETISTPETSQSGRLVRICKTCWDRRSCRSVADVLGHSGRMLREAAWPGISARLLVGCHRQTVGVHEHRNRLIVARADDQIHDAALAHHVLDRRERSVARPVWFCTAR